MSRYFTEQIMVSKLMSVVDDLVSVENYIDALAALWEIQYDYGSSRTDTHLAQKILQGILPRVSSRFPMAIDHDGGLHKTANFSLFSELTSSYMVHCIVCNNSYRLLPGYSVLTMLLTEGAQVGPDLAIASGHFGNNPTFLQIAGICSNVHGTLECTVCHGKANYLNDFNNYLSLVRFSVCVKDQKESLSTISAPKPKRRQLQNLATNSINLILSPSDLDNQRVR